MTTMEEKQLYTPGTLLRITCDLLAIRGNQQGWPDENNKFILSRLSNEIFVYLRTQGNLLFQGSVVNGILLLRGDGTVLWLWHSTSSKMGSWFTEV